MSETTYGIATNEVKPKHNFQADQRENGGWIGSQTFTVNRGDLSDDVLLAQFVKGTTASTLDPTLGTFGDRFYLQSARIVSRSGGFAEVAAAFTGYTEFAADPDNPQDTNPTYNLRGALREAPIEEHHSVQALSLANRLLIAGMVSGQYVLNSSSKTCVRVVDEDGVETLTETSTQPSAGDAADFCAEIAKGKTTYPTPTYTWTKTWEAEQAIPDSALNNLGKVDTPDGDPPEADGNRDWMLSGVDQEQKGQLFRNRLQWQLSERGGFNSTIHDY